MVLGTDWICKNLPKIDYSNRCLTLNTNEFNSMVGEREEKFHISNIGDFFDLQKGLLDNTQYDCKFYTNFYIKEYINKGVRRMTEIKD
jgi:hypothetical protein